MSKKKAFTLVELLAVIVILAIILVIAVPQIMNVIKESRKGALASSAKLIASSAETAYVSNQTLGIEKGIECKDISNYTDEDYASCSIKFVDGKAKVKIIGQGKFEGMAVCGGTKENAEVVEECPEPVSFENDSWETIASAVQDGDTGNYNVGDTKTVDLGELGEHTLRIANKTACDGTLASETACGFVIEFADIIIDYKMNTTDTNARGWPASAMRKHLNDLDSNDNTDGVIYNALVSAIGNIIIDTKVVSGHGSGDTSNFISIDRLYLLSTREVLGIDGGGDSAGGDEITRQLDYYKNNNVSATSRSGAIKKNGNTTSVWWFRSAHSDLTDGFLYMTNLGGYTSYNAIKTYGVSPAFRLG